MINLSATNFLDLHLGVSFEKRYQKESLSDLGKRICVMGSGEGSSSIGA